MAISMDCTPWKNFYSVCQCSNKKKIKKISYTQQVANKHCYFCRLSIVKYLLTFQRQSQPSS